MVLLVRYFQFSRFILNLVVYFQKVYDGALGSLVLVNRPLFEGVFTAALTTSTPKNSAQSERVCSMNKGTPRTRNLELYVVTMEWGSLE